MCTYMRQFIIYTINQKNAKEYVVINIQSENYIYGGVCIRVAKLFPLKKDNRQLPGIDRSKMQPLLYILCTFRFFYQLHTFPIEKK